MNGWRVDLTKVSLVFLPESADSALSTWLEFASHSPALHSCPEEILVRSLAVRFHPDNRGPIFLLAKGPSVAAFHLARNACDLPFEELLPAQPEVQPIIESSRIRFANSIAVFLLAAALPFAWENLRSRTETEVARQQLESGAVSGNAADMLSL